MPSENLTVYLTQRLEGRDQHIELLSQLFEESQVVTVETADPVLDLISFAQDATDFWVINAIDSSKAAAKDPLSDDSWPEEEPTNSLGLLPPSEFGYSAATHPHPPADSGAHERFAEMLNTGGNPSSSASCQSDTIPRNRPRCTNQEIYQLTQDRTIAGFIYLLPSSAYPDALHFQEYNIGIILRPQWRGCGVGKEALRLALDLIFSHTEVHRVQAQLIDCYRNDKALTLFTHMGFSHEGTRRQGFHCPLTAEWKDVTTLAVVAMDWLMQDRGGRSGFRSAPKSLWDALFARHQREREELLRWQDKRPRHTTSLETVRGGATTPIPGNLGETDASDAEAASPSESERAKRPKRKLFEIGDGSAGAGDAYDASSSECESDFESVIGGSPPKRFRTGRGETSLAAEDVNILEANWLNADLGALPNSTHTLAASINRTTDGTAGGRRVSYQRFEDSSDQQRSARTNASPSPDSSPSPSPSPSSSFSPSPEPREGSVISVPSSEPESGTEPGYTNSESGSESSHSGWELVESGDEFGR